MKDANGALALWLAVLVGGLAVGCSSEAHTLASRPAESSPAAASRPAHPSDQAYVAQAATCWDSMSCRIQSHPIGPVGSCGADPLDAARLLEAMAKLKEEATQAATLKGVDVPERGEERDDGEEREDWKEWCIEQLFRLSSALSGAAGEVAYQHVRRAQAQAQKVEGPMTDEERLVWQRFEKLERRVLERGESLELSDETRAILSGGARPKASSASLKLCPG